MPRLSPRLNAFSVHIADAQCRRRGEKLARA